VWVIMVDHSGSMGEGFRESGEQSSFRVRRTQQAVKLQAAVESVLIELPRLPARSDVTLCGFTSSAHVLHRGLASDQADFATALRGLIADGGTDIAAALDSARTQVSAAKPPSPAPDLPEASRILLITDGLSDREKARQAARNCARDGLTVDVILIDPTDEAQDLAAAVAGETNGRWEPVFGPEDLSRAAADARAAMEIEAQQTREAARAVEAEAGAVRAERAARDAVLFRASYPGALTADAWHPLFVHVHTERMEGELRARLGRLIPSLGPRPRQAEVPAGSEIAPGTELEIQPVIEHVRCRPPRIPVIWAEQLEEARFEIAYAGSAGSADACHGDVLVLASGLVIAKIPVSLQVTTGGAADEAARRTTTVRMIRQVFGSYAREDADIVGRLRAAYQALGILLFVDTHDINTGMPWKKFVRDQIGASDLFQLFWSQASAASAEVANEWQHALLVAAERPQETNFIRPVYWTKPLPHPPEPLAAINFWYFDPQSVGLQGAGPAGWAGEARWSARRADVRFPVITLREDPGGVTAYRVQDALSAIVPFLEEVTGLRYYPPATYLVDEAIVTGIRPAAEPDARGAPAEETPGDELSAKQAALVNRLNRLLSVFHDHGNPRVVRQDQHVHEQAQRGFARNVRLYLTGGTPRVGSEDFPAYARGYVNRLLALVQQDLHIPNDRRVPNEFSEPFELKHPGLRADIYLRSLARPVRNHTPVDHRYLSELSQTCTEALRLVDTRPPPQPAPAYLRLGVPAFGIFLYQDAGRDLGDQACYVPSDTPAVYVCAAAFERLACQLREGGMPEDAVPARAAAFLTATLVHEHMHAALATGLDPDGLAAATAGTGLWAGARSLNEALAAWAQRHFFRDDPEMSGECSRYIAAGQYPAWPYRGADALEADFTTEGVSAIRQAVHMLRSSPEIAQREFDARMAVP
jgi:hypothetical protein